ncbi:hypothetical protein SAMN05421837_112159 [Amycolatopsis pretoriensis]|uniref:Uncharacterized protein n=1 Tax=Amycolatopsis pretoriensis TaxID=218821 RepID=A0A1H5RH59_9PSEU|nr:hypothetical protein [Amycolatopsis pretoriensis]SEF37048.1 hypothetical protein SAMN05421837_112159 [Amycolatopsis pretoriensis]
MTSRLRAVAAVVFVALSFSFGAVVTTAAPTAARPDCVRPCHF